MRWKSLALCFVFMALIITSLQIPAAYAGTVTISPSAPKTGQSVTATAKTTVPSAKYARFFWYWWNDPEGVEQRDSGFLLLSDGTAVDLVVVKKSGQWSLFVEFTNSSKWPWKILDTASTTFLVSGAIPEFPLGLIPIFAIAFSFVILRLKKKQAKQTIPHYN